MSAPSVDIAVPRLAELIERGDALACSEWIARLTATDVVRTIDHLDEDLRHRLLALLDAGDAAEVLDRIPEPQAVDVLERLEPAAAARIVSEMPSDERADLMAELGHEDAKAILDALPAADAADVRRLSAYDEDVAGGLMVTEFLVYKEHALVSDVLRDIEDHAEEYRHYDIQYTYVTDAQGHLLGVVPMRGLLLAPRQQALRTLMLPDPIFVPDMTSFEELKAIFDEHPFVGLPVVDAQHRLVGVVKRDGLEHARVEESEADYRLSQGIVGGEELRSMPLVVRSRRRLAWLSINILLNILAASVIATHQDTLEAVIALAVFLPIISDMSGCSGNQAVAVSMREITLGILRPRDFLRVLRKELMVGLINGFALGVLIGLVALAWKGNWYLGGVVGLALMLNTILAVAIGGTVPLLLKGIKMDPALASGPILTTITDMCGFFLVLTLAAQVLHLIR